MQNLPAFELRPPHCILINVRHRGIDPRTFAISGRRSCPNELVAVDVESEETLTLLRDRH